MPEVAISVNGLSKMYRIGRVQKGDPNLQEVITQSLLAPFRRIAGLARGNATAAADLDEEFWALQDVSFEVRRGETVALVGGNGAGKSTLLKLLSRITEPTKGSATIRGRVGTLLEVGTGFHPELTGRENVFLNGSILGMQRSEVIENFDEIVAFSEIGSFIDTPVKHYSSGMKVRLAFSVASHLEPEVMFVDEVLAVGDAAFRKKCLQKIQQISRRGTTVLLVSHNAQAVTSMCDRAIWLKEGQIVGDGPASDVVSAYLSESIGLGGERIWTDDEKSGGDVARVKAVRVRNEQGNVVDTVDVREAFYLETEVEVLKSGFGLAMKYDLFTSENLGAFSSVDTQNPTWEGKTWDKGVYTLSMKVPGNFLQLDTYVLNFLLMCLEPVSSSEFYQMDALCVHIVDRESGPTAAGGFIGNFPGAVRPLLEWNMTALGSPERVSASN